MYFSNRSYLRLKNFLFYFPYSFENWCLLWAVLREYSCILQMFQVHRWFSTYFKQFLTFMYATNLLNSFRKIIFKSIFILLITNCLIHCEIHSYSQSVVKLLCWSVYIVRCNITVRFFQDAHFSTWWERYQSKMNLKWHEQKKAFTNWEKWKTKWQFIICKSLIKTRLLHFIYLFWWKHVKSV